jgi:copper chaperone CopZ
VLATYNLTGLTCQHCVNHVTEEVSALAGVDRVEVSLEAGRMTVDSAQPIDFDLIVAAVAEAGEDYGVSPA